MGASTIRALKPSPALLEMRDRLLVTYPSSLVALLLNRTLYMASRLPGTQDPVLKNLLMRSIFSTYCDLRVLMTDAEASEFLTAACAKAR